MQFKPLVVISVIVLGVGRLLAQNLPPPVDLSEFPSAVREQLKEAYESARTNPTDAGASG